MKLLIATHIHPFFAQTLQNAGFACDTHILKNTEELFPIIHDYEGIVINSRFAINKNFIDLASHLKFIARVGAGMENIDVDYLSEKGILCFNSPEANRQAVGEHSIGMLLNLLNKICIANAQVKSGQWLREENRGTELSGKTVGIIGYGNMGSAFAECLQGFNVRCIAYDKYKVGYANSIVEECRMEEVFEQSDVVSMHVPLTEETLFMVNEVFLQSFAKKIYLLNTARGKVVKTADLVAQLQKGKVLGAGLDVLEFEALNFENISLSHHPDLLYLRQADNVLLSPHIAGWTYEADEKHARVLAEKIIRSFIQ